MDSQMCGLIISPNLSSTLTYCGLSEDPLNILYFKQHYIHHLNVWPQLVKHSLFNQSMWGSMNHINHFLQITFHTHSLSLVYCHTEYLQAVFIQTVFKMWEYVEMSRLGCRPWDRLLISQPGNGH